MQIIRLPETVGAAEAAMSSRVRTPPTGDDFQTVVEPPARVFYPDGRLAAVYGVSEALSGRLRERLPWTPYQPTGIRTQGAPSRSAPFGGRPRFPLRAIDYCGRCVFEDKEPELYDDLVALGAEMARWYADEQPDLYAEQMAWVEGNVRSEYRMVGPYTSGIINWDNALPLHRDSGNIKQSWNAMIVMRDATDGGQFVVPAWRLAFAAGDGHALLLDAQATMHGVTPIVKRRRRGYRTSVVFYSLRQLATCLSPDEELVRARRVRTEREERSRKVRG